MVGHRHMYVCLLTKAGHFAAILPAVCSPYSNTKYAWLSSCVKVALKLIFQGPVLHSSSGSLWGMTTDHKSQACIYQAINRIPFLIAVPGKRRAE